MDEHMRAMLYIYAVEDDPSDAQTFTYRGHVFRWSVIADKHI
jgi:hypothetical protein